MKMKNLIESLVLFGQSYSDSLFKFKIGFSVAAIGLVLTGLSVAFNEPNPFKKQASPALKWATESITILSGLGLLAYTWIAL